MKYQINDIVFDTQEHTLLKNNKLLRLEAKSFQLLIYFIESNGRVCSRDELIADVWQGQIVSDGAVNKAISKLRGHFEQLSPDTLFIDTKTKFGYQFCADIARLQQDQTSQGLTSAKNRRALLIMGLLFTTLILAMLFWWGTIKDEPSTPQPLRYSSLLRFSAQDGVETKLSNSASGDVLFHSLTADNSQKLILKSSNGKEQTIPLELDAKSTASLSPSGQSIAYVDYDSKHCSVFISPTSMNHRQEYFNCARFSDIKLAWAHDEQSLFIQARENNATPYSIYQLQLATRSLQQITLPVGLSHLKGDYLLAHHPTKPLLAFARYLGSERSEVHVIDINSLTTKKVYALAHTINALTWHVKHEQLYVAHQKQLFALNKDTSTTLIKQFSYPIESIASTFINGQTAILATQYQPSTKIQSYDLYSHQTVTLHQNAAFNRLPRELASEQLLFISDMAQTHALWQLKNGELSQLVLPFEFGFRRYDIDEDGELILFEKHGALYEFNLSDQSITQLFSAEHKAYVANYLTSQETIIYSSNQSAQWQLWEYNKQTKQHHQLTHFGGYNGYYYKDALIYSKRNQDGLWIKSQQNEEEKLIADFKNINWLNWQLINEHIYFYRPKSGIWKYNIITKTEQLIMVKPERFIHQYTISKDERKVIFVELQPLQGDIQALVVD